MTRSGARELIRDLRARVGDEAVVTEPGARAVYECDGYTLERAVPDLVVHPADVEQTVEVVRCLAAHGAPMVPRGAGTSLAGGCLAPSPAVVVSLSRLTRIEELDPLRGRARVQAGVVNLALTRAAAPHGLRFAPDPSSQSACTIGGNVANNSGGPHTLKEGVTANHVLAVELVTPDGTHRWIGSPFPGAGGPDVTGLVVGSEGTFGIVTRAWVRLTPAPAAWRTLLAAFDSVDAAGHAVSRIIASGVVPAAVEMMDAPILVALHDAFGMEFPEGAKAVLLLEVDGPDSGLDHEAAVLEASCRDAGATSVRAAADPGERDRLWSPRKRAFGALGRLARNYCTQDGVVPRSRLPEVLRRIEAIGVRHALPIANVFHAGDGNLHPVLLYDERDPDQVRRVLAASTEVLKACLDLGGSLTGEHGIGVEKRELMQAAFSSDTLTVMGRVRAVFDPEGRANPGKLLPAGGGCTDDGNRDRGLGRVHPGRQAPQ